VAVPAEEVYISVDVETSGPSPSRYSLLAIGACVAYEPTKTFSVELQPVTDAFLPAALEVSGLNLDHLRAHGLPPGHAMGAFAAWVADVAPAGRPVFVGLNAPFDWMFVADYFDRFLGENPFGHKAIDIKALYMGRHRTTWAATNFEQMAAQLSLRQTSLTHHALEDALVQADLFRRVLDQP
jgi:DNA polymerase III epsilon subunit-like protein